MRSFSKKSFSKKKSRMMKFSIKKLNKYVCFDVWTFFLKIFLNFFISFLLIHFSSSWSNILRNDFIILIILCDRMKKLYRWWRINAIDHVTHQSRNYLRRLNLNDDCSLNFVIISITLSKFSRVIINCNWNFNLIISIYIIRFFLFSILSIIFFIFYWFSSSIKFEICIICFVFLSLTRWR